MPVQCPAEACRGRVPLLVVKAPARTRQDPGGTRRKNPGHARHHCLLNGQTLESILIMEYVWKSTDGVLVNEEPLRGRE